MATKITLEELQKKIGDPRIDEKSLRRYFLMDEERSGAFEPVLQLNPETVKVEPTPEGRARGEMLLSSANRLARLRRRWAFEAKISEGYAGPIIVSEGDSWFQFPILLDDTIDNLSRDYAIRSLDAAGDTLDNMFREGEYLDALHETKASILLFSAGGNDVLGGSDLKEHLRDFDAGLSPADHLKPSFHRLLDHAIALYEKIFRSVEALPGDIVTICHGYDKPLPSGGKWLGKPMEARGIMDRTFQKAITDHLIDSFNARMKDLARMFPRVVHLDLRGVVGPKPSRWHDELHPKDPGYADVAKQFKIAIDETTQARAQPRARGGVARARPAAIRRGVSLHVGLNTIDPSHYGTDGALAACEFDAEDMSTIAKANGYEVAGVLLGTQATRENVIGQIAAVAEQLKPGDLFLLTYAGHGAQTPDFNRDEEDGIDETLCLYDAMMIDDELFELWSRFREGVRVLMVSDSCHSGSQIRAAARPLQLPGAPKARFLDPRFAARAFRNNREFYERIGRATRGADEGLLVRELTQQVRCSVRLLSGCQDNQVSLDGYANGRFTEELLKVWDEGRFDGDYDAFHRRIVNGMPATQTPNHWKIGADNPGFDGQKPFSI
jgi:hypothetical protein